MAQKNDLYSEILLSAPQDIDNSASVVNLYKCIR